MGTAQNRKKLILFDLQQKSADQFRMYELTADAA